MQIQGWRLVVELFNLDGCFIFVGMAASFLKIITIFNINFVIENCIRLLETIIIYIWQQTWALHDNYLLDPLAALIIATHVGTNHWMTS